MSNNIKKTAIITGGNKGIGLEIAMRFARENYTVFVGSRSDLEMQILNIHHVPMDVRRPTSHQMIVNHAMLKTGRVDVYINNAGYSEWRPLGQIDEEFLDDIISTNLKSAFWGAKAAVTALLSKGSIINVSSIAGKRGTANNSAYVATKFGMNGMTQALAKELGAKGIRVNGVCPVLIPTPGLMTALESDYSPAGDNPIQWMQEVARTQSALQRLPTGREVADMCFFLASDAATAITGQNINVDCGVLPQ
jgi:3-oxoacyl-[acyl-carrier protein] reductase/meso-butanediol dehydrogenase/(S,S)-butanediol dehydrogenase/diacetyl reductase